MRPFIHTVQYLLSISTELEFMGVIYLCTKSGQLEISNFTLIGGLPVMCETKKFIARSSQFINSSTLSLIA